MKTPRDLSGIELIALIRKNFGYEITRQKGSHIRVSTQKNGEHHLSIPNHSPIRIGTLENILKDICIHFELSREELLQILF